MGEEGAPRAAAAAVAASAGAASLAVEFAAVRLLAPWFGQSSLVWAHALAVVLLALAVGQWVGGALASRRAAVDVARVALGASALWLLAAARVGPALAAWVAPTERGGDLAYPLSAWGSLFAALVLFGPPVLALGIAAPVWIHRLAGTHGAARSSGLVFAAGTAGSLIGSYLAPLLLLPWLGARRTLDVTAALVAAAGLVGLRRGALGETVGSRPGGGPVVLGPRLAAAGPCALAALIGLWVTGCEFAAVRALAPAFGQSNLVWASVVGVILLGLALGNALGGRLARHGSAARALPAALAVGALWIGAASVLGRPLAAALGPAGSSARGEVRDLLANLAAAALLFGAPMAAFGVASPILTARLSAVRGPGRAAGAVLVAGTAGSLLGCYATPLWFLPSLGTRATLETCAAGLLLAALATALRPPRGAAAGAAP